MDKDLRGRKTLLRPSRKQRRLMARYAGAARFAWNVCLAFCRDIYDLYHRLPSELECRHYLVLLRNTVYPWLKDIPECISHREVKLLHLAYKRAFDNWRNNRTVSKKKNKKTGRIINPYGFPQFKGKHYTKKSFYERTDMIHKTDRNHIHLTGFKKPVLLYYREIPDKIYNPWIKQDFQGRWYICYNFEPDVTSKRALPSSNDVRAVDLGSKDMGVTDQGIKYRNPNKDPHPKRLEVRKRYLQRRVSRKYEANKNGNIYHKTANIKKLEQKIARLCYRIANYRDNAQNMMVHQISAARPKCVVLEDLNVKGMMSNPYLAKAVGQVGFGTIRRKFKSAAELYGYRLIIADRWFASTQICSNCGAKTGPKGFDGLKTRSWICSNCGAEHDRDQNAGQNLRQWAIDHYGLKVDSSGSVCRSKSPGSPTQTQVAKAKAGALKRVSARRSQNRQRTRMHKTSD